MQKQDIYQLMNQNPTFFLATVEGDTPRVRGMMLYRADENGILFHTGAFKDLYQQVKKNPKAELCFVDYQTFTQVRISGILEIMKDADLVNEIIQHPSREFVQEWVRSGLIPDPVQDFIVFRMKNGNANIWTMANNFEPNLEIPLD